MGTARTQDEAENHTGLPRVTEMPPEVRARQVRIEGLTIAGRIISGGPSATIFSTNSAMALPEHRSIGEVIELAEWVIDGTSVANVDPASVL